MVSVVSIRDFLCLQSLAMAAFSFNFLFLLQVWPTDLRFDVTSFSKVMPSTKTIELHMTLQYKETMLFNTLTKSLIQIQCNETITNRN